jgi:hypothetical protein
VDDWHFIAERKIREAMQEGAFDRLEGKGEPLDLSENPYEDPSLRMAHRLLKNNGFAPAWRVCSPHRPAIRESGCLPRDSQRACRLRDPLRTRIAAAPKN